MTVKRYSLDTRVWTSDSLYQEWLSEGWMPEIGTERGFGLAPMKGEGERIVYPDEDTRRMQSDE